MSDTQSKGSFNASGSQTRKTLPEMAEAIMNAIKHRPEFRNPAVVAPELVSPNFFRRGVGMEAQIHLSAGDNLPSGSFYLIGFYSQKGQESVDVSCVIRGQAPESGQAEPRGHKSRQTDITGLGYQNVLAIIGMEIDRVTPTGNIRGIRRSPVVA